MRFRAADRNFTGEQVVGILRHRGESPATAIILTHDEERDPELPEEPVGGPGAADVCWFTAAIPRLLSDEPFMTNFSLFNRNEASNRAARWTLFGPDHITVIDHVSGTDPELIIEHSTAGGDVVYLTLERHDVHHTLFTARWTAPLSALYLRHPLSLFCEDETGLDWAGSDEITVKLYLDGETDAFFETQWEADTDESLELREGVTNAIRLRLDSAGLSHDAVPFVSGIRVEVSEDDGILGTSTANVSFTPSTESEKKAVTLPMDLQSGRYSVHAMVGKWRF